MVDDRDTGRPAFVFGTTENGSGWVPERDSDRQGMSVVVTGDYDAAELPTEEGEELEVLDDDLTSGGLGCRAKDGRHG